MPENVEYEAECCVWFKVRFVDNGTDALCDQAHGAALEFVGTPMSRLDDLEVHGYGPVTPGTEHQEPSDA